MACKECKKKEKPIESLTSVNFEDLKTAYLMLQTPSRMNDQKWDFVEDIYMELFPAKGSIKRSCKTCLINVAKSIEYEYNKAKSKN